MATEHRALHISRRRLMHGAGVAGLGLVVGCGRLPGQIQQPPAPRIGYLGNVSSNQSSLDAFREGLRDLGYMEEQNVVIDVRWAEGQAERYPALAAELVQLRPDVLVTTTTQPTQAAMQATSTIPIVFSAISDPVALGMAASLARPGGHLTGQSDLFAGLSGKRLQLLRETVPGATRVAILWNPTNPASALEWSAAEEAARTLGIEVLAMQVRTADDLAGAFETVAREHADGLVVMSDGLLSAGNTPQLASLLGRRLLPTMHYDRVGAAAGALMAYGPNLSSLYRRAAYYVDRILKGAKPADLPIEQPREFDFIINLQTAQALGLTIPQHVLLQATEVIQ